MRHLADPTRRAALAAGLVATAAAPLAAAAPPPPGFGYYELRVYTPAPGKAAALHARFREHTIRILGRHGIASIAYFNAVDPADPRLFFVLGYADAAARERAWAAFMADPEMASVRAATERDGPLVAKREVTFFTPAEYSPPLDLARSAAPRVFELRVYHCNPGRLERLHQRFREVTVRLFAKHGMTNVVYWRAAPGQPGWDNELAYLLAFPTLAAREAAWAAFIADEEFQRAAQESEREGPLLRAESPIDSTLLAATDYSPLQ